MLTIENISKLYKMDAGEWRVGKVETMDSAYLIKLYKHNRRETTQVNIERNPIGQRDTALYELWFWNGTSTNVNYMSPVRRLMSVGELKKGPSHIAQTIGDMLTLK
jgi:hypothetical protein